MRADLLPVEARESFAPPSAPAGQVGCFLAHMKAWETLIGRNDDKALIIEDDALPMFKFSLASILDRMPEDADIVFVNLRANPIWRASEFEASPREIEYIPMESLDPSAYVETTAIGGDGYLLSARGAARLIAINTHTKLHFHVDWQIFMACLRRPFANKIIPAARSTWFHQEVAKIGHLNGYILKMPIIQELRLDYSPRRLLSS